jgi:hypothetical protein
MACLSALGLTIAKIMEAPPEENDKEDLLLSGKEEVPA